MTVGSCGKRERGIDGVVGAEFILAGSLIYVSLIGGLFDDRIKTSSLA